MTIDTIRQPAEAITLETIDLHPLVKAELQIELKKWMNTLEQIAPERLQSVQGKVEILKWVLQRMPGEIVAKAREKAKAAEEKE